MPATSSLFGRVGGMFVPVTPASSPPIPSVQSPPPSDPASTGSDGAVGQSGPSPTVPNDLALLEQAIAEAEQLVPQAVPTAMLQVAADAQAAAQATQVSGRSGNKEALAAAAATPDAQAAVESGQSVQYVEYEPNPELPPEVEGYLNRVEQHADQAPKEVVIADIAQAMPMTHQLPSQPVIVLPITPAVEAAGAKKSPKFSIRWLVEWSRKIMKVFVGRVIYRTSEV